MMVAEHKHDHHSNIVQIAKLTLQIRGLQKEMGLMAQKGWRSPGKKKMLVRFGNIHLLRNHFWGGWRGSNFAFFYYAHSCEIGKSSVTWS